MKNRALSELRIIDLTHYIAGPYCTKLMAGFGADVIKIERPQTGDKLRSVPPFNKNENGVEHSIPFHWLNTGKKSVTLDLKTERDVGAFKKLVQNADVVVENFSPRVMPGLGLGYGELLKINPNLIMASISNFGQTGPYKDYQVDEIELSAMCGAMYMTGEECMPPLTPGPALCQYSAGMHAYLAILFALFQRKNSGGGKYIDVSIMESGLEYIENAVTNFLHLGKIAKRGAHTFAPWGLYKCLDGYATVICAPFRHWTRGVNIFQEPRLMADKYKHVKYRSQHRKEVDELIQPWLSKNKKKDIFQLGQGHNFAFGYLSTFDEVLESPQHKDRGFFVEVDHPVVGKHKYCGAPFIMSETPWKTLRAPLLGEHNQDILNNFQDESEKKTQHLKEDYIVATEKLPLNGIRVIDLTHAWSGPHCTRLLADFGAEVIRVEYAQRMGLFRGGIKENQGYNKQPAWFQLNRNKYAITLDLKNEKDRDSFADLVKSADIVIENARTGVMDRLGFGYKKLIGIKPNLIMVSMPAFGNTGPYAINTAYGAVLEAMSGIQNLTAYGKNEKPQRVREMDVVNGIGGACAAMTALLHRQRTGCGQHVDMSQMEFPTHALIGEHLLEFVMNKTHVSPMGNRHLCFAPQGCYRCQGEDKWVTLTVRTEDEWRKLCDVLGHPEWKTDTRFASRVARVENHEELDCLIEEWTTKHTHYEAMRILQNNSIASGAVLNVAEISTDPHLRKRGYFTKSKDGVGGLFPGMPFRLSNGNGGIRWVGPDLGQHNEYVLCEMLGRPRAEVKPINENEIGTAYDTE